MGNIALRIWQILYTFVLRVESNTQLTPFGIHSSWIIQNYRKFANLAWLYFYSLQHFTTKRCNFTKFRMLFQALVIFS